MSQRSTVLKAMLGVVVVGVAVGLLVLFTGAYNVAATAEHFGVTHWALNTMQEFSVAARAGDIESAVPTDPDALEHGFEHYDAMCVMCHGGPGVERGEYGKGMNPRPPDLVAEADEWTDGELFWITKHGIRIAGMPAFGPTHTDDEIWGLVAAMRALPGLTPEDYAARIAAVRAAGGGHDDTMVADSSSAADTTAGDGHAHTH